MRVQPSSRSSSDAQSHRWTRFLADTGNTALGLTCVGWAIIFGFILSHRVFVTNDSLSNYAHVWYAADRFWSGHGIPLRMPALGHGDAYAFPYAFVPWFTAALLRPVFGDWIVTLWLFVGFAGLGAATWWAFPELRSGWWMAILLAEPMLVEAPVLGQLPFLWASAMLFAAVACWRRGLRAQAAVVFGIAQATHPAVMLPIAGVLVVARLYREPHRRALLAAYACSLAIAAPAAWIVLVSPAVEDASTRTLVGNLAGTVILRAIVVAAPFIALVVIRTPLGRLPALIFAAVVALNFVLVPVRHNGFAWHGLTRDPDTSLAGFLDSDAFVPGATYRLQRASDGKYGMYQMLQRGARLDSEMFPESLLRRSWPDAASYAALLDRRRVDYVIIEDAYDALYRTNEHHLLDELTTSSSTTPGGTQVAATRIVHDGRYDVYEIQYSGGRH